MGNQFFPAFRKQQELSRKDLARLLGISESMVGHIERGDRGITVKRAIEWADVLGVHPGDILFADPAEAAAQ